MNTSITGWTVTLESIDYIGTLWQASNGVRSVDLDGQVGDAGTLSQTFDTTSGTQYRVTFDLAGNPFAGPTIKTLQVSAASDATTFTFDITGQGPSNMGYLPQSFFFTATAPTTTLAFTSLTAPAGFGPVIDNVSVAAVPVDGVPAVPGPSTWLLLATGTAGLLAYGWRRRLRAV